ncbi:hypothetical protein [Bremerella sp. P1]|uniref:hypothetical protein n=1 Tax=Bremerella sp. P1 TaxID=3026424 RepID=UPI00236813CE|nr:hypothetical protein [Bremerella sp. P1]WDI42245.1 hypothetical protein PSR63_27720 [Bremerella sp. P1]
MTQNAPEKNATQEDTKKVRWYYFSSKNEPWWSEAIGDFASGYDDSGCGCGCLLVFLSFTLPFLILVTGQDGKFKLQFGDLTGMLVLLISVTVFRVNLGPDPTWANGLGVPLLMGVVAGIVMAAVRQRPVWLFAGPISVPFMILVLDVIT